MKKVLFFFLLAAGSLSAQIEDRLSYLTESEATKYVTPLATTLGVAFNSASYIDADIPSLFGFSFSIRAMGIIIPEDDKTFIPDAITGYDKTKSTATFYGAEGTYYAGIDGYQVYPPGIDESFIPLGYPQITLSLLGTELLVRGLPEVTIAEQKVSMLGLGVSHSISRYIPLLPVDIAAQILYNKFTIKDILDVKNIAFNVHASRSFGLFTAYGGLQYENTSFDLTYTYKQRDPLNPNEYLEKDFDLNAKGDNNFRVTLGGAISLAFLQINADVNLGAQTAFTSGLTFSF